MEKYDSTLPARKRHILCGSTALRIRKLQQLYMYLTTYLEVVRPKERCLDRGRVEKCKQSLTNSILMARSECMEDPLVVKCCVICRRQK